MEQLLANINLEDIILVITGAVALGIVLGAKQLLGMLLGLVIKSENKYDDKLVLSILEELVKQEIITLEAKGEIVAKMTAPVEAPKDDE